MRSPVDYSERRTRVVHLIGGVHSATALLVTNPANVRWLTGLASSNAAILLRADVTILVTDSRYRDPALAVPGVQLVIARDVARQAIVAGLTAAASVAGAAAGESAVAFESDSLSAAEHQRLESDPDFTAVTFIPTAGLVAQLRTIKEPAEIELIRQACEISTAALRALVDQVRVGMSEVTIARTLEYELAAHGADDRAFPTIAAAGPNTATPHHQPTHRPVGRGEVLKIDFGAMVQGYHADCTRCFVVGAQPSDRHTEIHQLVHQGAAAGRDALVAGVTIADVDLSARSVIAGRGFGEYFSHGLGHGIGLEIHEPPLLSGATGGTLARGNVVTIEPGVYLPDEFGIRIEDTCVVTDGSAEVLTDFPRELTVIDG
jgi:Xaa-Pro aminopeptidase